MLAVAPAEIELPTLTGHSQTLGEWLTVFNLLAVIIDPYTHQSGWIIPTANRLFDTYEEADVRCAFVVTSDAEGATAYLGEYAPTNLVLLDPDREFTKAVEVATLPALVHVDQSCRVAGTACGWQPDEWLGVLMELEEHMSWRSRPVLPSPGDPGAFEGTPALA